MNTHPPESVLMAAFRRLRMDPLAWSLRRLHCPVSKEALVLEVGSGGNPYFRSNVLLDAFENTRQRHWVPLIADRPTVLGEVEQLPFRDKAFDFVIASHVLEHSTQPEQFLRELQRVAKAGYIETPDAFMERLNPYRDHRLEVTIDNNSLVVRKKTQWCQDNELCVMYEKRAKSPISQQTIPQNPFHFHVRYYWSDTITYRVVNPQARADWPAPEDRSAASKKAYSLRSHFHMVALGWLRAACSQKRRNKRIKLNELLACPACRSTGLEHQPHFISCNVCHNRYPVRNGMPVMFANPER